MNNYRYNNSITQITIIMSSVFIKVLKIFSPESDLNYVEIENCVWYMNLKTYYLVTMLPGINALCAN